MAVIVFHEQIVLNFIMNYTFSFLKCKIANLLIPSKTIDDGQSLENCTKMILLEKFF